MKKRNQLIIISCIIIFIILTFIVSNHFKNNTTYNLRPSKNISSSWILPDNDGIGEAKLFLYKDNTFELMNKDDLRTGLWKILPNNLLQLQFTDKKNKYDLSTNKYFTNTKVMEPYLLHIKIIKKPSEYLDFFNYFFYKQ